MVYEAICTVDLALGSRTFQLMTCDQQTHLSSKHITNLLDPKPKEFTAFQGNIFALTVSHSFILKPDKELKFHLHLPFLGSNLLIEGDHEESFLRPGGVRSRNQTYKSCSLWGSGKIPIHHCPDRPVSCCPSSSNISTSADSQYCMCLGGGRGGRGGQEVQKRANWRWQTSLGSGLGFEMFRHCS